MGNMYLNPAYMWDTISSLVRGQVIYCTLTVREGLTVEEIGELIEQEALAERQIY